MNDDFISRWAAIDAIEFGITYARAINKETGEVKELFQEGNDELRKAVERVKELPPAQQTCNKLATDCISRQDAVSRFSDLLMVELKGKRLPTWDEVYNAMQDVPSADVQPRKTAEWIYGEKDGADGWYCSKCGFHIPWYYDYYGLKNINFISDFHTCPHCDAKMVKYTGMKGEWNG